MPEQSDKYLYVLGLGSDQCVWAATYIFYNALKLRSAFGLR